MITKSLTLLFAIIFTLQAQANYAPTSIKGQQDASAEVLTNLQAPNHQATKTGNRTWLLENGNTNILENPSWEHQTANSGWTLTAGTFVSDNSPVHGAKNAQLSLTAQALEFYQDSTLYASQFADGVQGKISIWVRTTNPNIYWCQRKAGVNQITSDGTVITNCAHHSGSGKWELLEYPVTLGSTSNGAALLSLTASTGAALAITSDVEADGAKLEYAGVTGTTTVDTAWESCGHVAADFTGFGTMGTISTECKRSGSDLLIKGKFVMGAGTGVEARMALKFRGQSLTSANTPIISSIQKAGEAVYSVVSASMATVLIEPNVTYATFGIQSGAAAGITKTFGNTFTSSLTLVINARIPIAGWASNSDYLSAQCGASCVDTHVAYMDVAAGTISGENVDFINGNGGGTSSIRTVTFNSGVYTVTPVCDLQLVSNATSTAGIINGTLGIFTTGITNIIALHSSTGATITNGTIKISCTKTGVDFNATRTLVASLKEVNTTPGIPKPITANAYFGNGAGGVCDSATCTALYYSRLASDLTMTRSGLGAYALGSAAIFKPNTWVHCQISLGNANIFRWTGLRLANSSGQLSAVTIETQNRSSAASVDATLDVHCEGQAP